jgi:hypothetical protein
VVGGPRGWSPVYAGPCAITGLDGTTASGGRLHLNGEADERRSRVPARFSY